MSMIDHLGFNQIPSEDLDQWVIITETDWISELNQSGRDHVSLVQLTDGRYACNANILSEENGIFSDALMSLPTGDVKAAPINVCLAFLDRPKDDDAKTQWPEWEQVLGAGLGPQGAEDGWPVGAKVLRNGKVWTSRVPGNVNEPLVGASSTWSRDDGTYVVPAGWQYQPGEEVTEDGGATWWRALQEVSHSPSAYPAGYVQIDGPGGDPLPEDRSWVQPSGAQDAYAVDDLVTHDNPQDGGAIWVYRSKIDANTTEPGRDGTFDRWWQPVSAA